MREVSKEEFKEMYFQLGGGEETGWGPDYWNGFFEKKTNRPMKYLVRDPETPEHTRMMIVTDYGCNEYRMFVVTEDEEERMFDFPAKDSE